MHRILPVQCKNDGTSTEEAINISNGGEKIGEMGEREREREETEETERNVMRINALSSLSLWIQWFFSHKKFLHS